MTDTSPTEKADDVDAEIIYQIRRHRLMRGLTPDDVAELTGISVPVLVTIEEGEKEVRLDYLLLLSVALDLPDNYFLDRLYKLEPRKPAKSKSDREVAIFLGRLAITTRNTHARAVLYSLIDGLPGSEDAFRVSRFNRRAGAKPKKSPHPLADQG